MVTSDDDDDDDDVESVIYYPKNPSCTLYVTLNVKKNSKIGRVFDRWQKRETTHSSHIACASERRFKTNVLLLLLSLSRVRVRASRFQFRASTVL